MCRDDFWFGLFWLAVFSFALVACEGRLSLGPAAADEGGARDGGKTQDAARDDAIRDDRGQVRDGLPPPTWDLFDGVGPPRDRGVVADSLGPTFWRPAPGTTWQWQLRGSVDTSFDVAMYDIDLFDSTPALIAQLKAAGRVVICYFSAGSYEGWRSDAASFPASVCGKKMTGWDELWLDIRATEVKAVMKKRLDLAQSKGCDGVEPDNVDGYRNDTGFSLSSADQIAFNTFIAQEAHSRGLSVGLKNDLDQVKQLEPLFDWALNEECVRFKECDLIKPFIAAGKAVFHAEYKGDKASVCGVTTPLGFSSLIKHLNLDAWYEACWQ